MVTTNQNMVGCPLCSGETVFFHQDFVRQYNRCAICKLVFVPEPFHVTPEREKQEYDLHENNCEDEGYLRFLSRFSDPFVKTLKDQKNGLDFGCGPGPALAGLIEQHGHSVALYDPLYRNDKTVLSKEYDFVTATEVVEHFRDPAKEFAQLFQMIVSGGYLGIMTKMVKDDAAFKTWHYIRDPTHVAFYSKETFTYIADQFGASVTFVTNDVIFFQKH
ncbi:MAG: hypothetical protein ACI8PB_002250 [Desulforhopalus sp.]|jgi:hypothetical protein